MAQTAQQQESTSATEKTPPMPEVARTLVKSPPELWAEVSDPASLARHLGAFGEIRITRLEPETTVAWEGDRIRGTVDLAPAGWGTKVTVTAAEITPGEAPPAEAEQEPQAAVEPEAKPGGLRALLRRWFGRRDSPEPEPVSEPVSEPEPGAEPEPVLAAPDTGAVLDGMLGTLGAAHHRPFSR